MQIPKEITLTEKIMREHRLCDNCLGRQFPKFKPELSNKEKGLLLRFLTLTKLKSETNTGYIKEELLGLFKKNQTCFLCLNIFDRIDGVIGLILERIREYNFESFLCGVRIPFNILEEEDRLKSKYRLRGESLRKEIVREAGLRINKITGKKTSFSNPEIKIIFEPYNNNQSMHIISKPIFLYGQYLVFSKIRAFHIILEKALLTKFGAERITIKEALSDTDGIILEGMGVPFIIKIINPKKRDWLFIKGFKIADNIQVIEIAEATEEEYNRAKFMVEWEAFLHTSRNLKGETDRRPPDIIKNLNKRISDIKLIKTTHFTWKVKVISKGIIRLKDLFETENIIIKKISVLKIH